MALDRRTFLRAAGVCLPLPWLEAMGVRSASVTNAGEITAAEIPRRAYFSNWGFFEVGAGVPKDTGANYTLTPTLAPLAPYKNDCTVLSGLRAFSGGHYQQLCLLTGMNTPSNGVKLVSAISRSPTSIRAKRESLRWCCRSNVSRPCLSVATRHRSTLRQSESRFDRLFGVETEQTRNARRDTMVTQQHSGSCEGPGQASGKKVGQGRSRHGGAVLHLDSRF